MRNYLFILLFAFPVLSFGQVEKLSLIETNKDNYRWITFLSQGDIDWLDEPINEVEGIAFRFIVTTSDIYNQMYIEKVTFGMEGCCKKISSKRELPIDNVFKLFGLKGERAGVEFGEWKSPTSFEFKIYDNKFLVEDTHKDKVLISKI